MPSRSIKLTRRQLLASSVGSVAALAAGPRPVIASTHSDDVSPFPESPHIVPAHGAPLFRGRENYGWQALNDTDRIRLVRGLHPDVADFRRLIWIESSDDGLPPGAAQQAEFSSREGVPGTSGQTIYVNADPYEAESQWGRVRKDNDWTYPDGTSVEDPTGLFAEKFDGSDHGYGVQNNGIGIPSVFAPGTLDVLMMGAKKAFEEGFSAMFLDSTTTPRLQGLDFSPWAQAAFRNHLATLSAEQIEELDVSDPSSLDVREAFRNRDLSTSDDQHPATDPLYREYLLFQHEGLQALLASYKERIDTAFPDRESGTTFLYGNQYIGDSLGNVPAAALHVSEILDFVNIEDNRTLPPDIVREPVYKLMRASAKGDKPVLFEGQMHDQPGSAESLRGLDPTRRYHTLQRLQLAEAYANGVPRKLPLTSWGNIEADKTVTHWVRKDGTIPEELQAFADFLWTNEHLLRPATPDNHVAVVCSIPTLLWENAPQWDRSPERHLDAFRGVCTLLREAQIPYDVVIFGHSRLYDDATHLDGLSDYDSIVLPGVTSIADRQVAALKEASDDGSVVITSATVPDRDGSYRSRTRDWLTGNAVTNLSDGPGLTRTRDDRTSESLVSALPEPIGVTIEEASEIGVNRLRTADPETLQLHLINYAYDRGTDSIRSVEDLTVSIPDSRIEFDPVAATYVAPGVRTDVDVEKTGDRVSIDLPRLDEWGFVVLAPEADTLSPPGDENTARDRLSMLMDRVERAEERLDVPSEDRSFVRASVFLREAQVALDAEVYDKAVARADAGLDAVATLPEMSTESSNETATGPDETTTDSNETTASDQTTTTDALGFGVVSSALAAAGGAIAVKSLQDGDEE